MKIVNQALAVALMAGTAAALAAGCGGNSSGNGADTGLPPTKLLSDVTQEEATHACERLRDGFKRRFNQSAVIEAACTMRAAANTSTSSSCSNLRDTCIEEASQPNSDAMMSLDLDAIDFMCDMAMIGDCGDATVADLESCFGDTLDALDGLLHRYDCSDAGTISDADLENTGFEPAASCEAVNCGGEGLFD